MMCLPLIMLGMVASLPVHQNTSNGEILTMVQTKAKSHQREPHMYGEYREGFCMDDWEYMGGFGYCVDEGQQVWPWIASNSDFNVHPEVCRKTCSEYKKCTGFDIWTGNNPLKMTCRLYGFDEMPSDMKDQGWYFFNKKKQPRLGSSRKKNYRNLLHT